MSATRFRAARGGLFAGGAIGLVGSKRDIGNGYVMQRKKTCGKKQPEIENLRRELFKQKWQPLGTDKSKELSYPGVYMIAWTAKQLAGWPIDPKDVFYVGMSNAVGGVRSRLGQFARGIKGGHYHSGAIRFYKHFGRSWNKYEKRKRFYAVAVTLRCESKKSNCGPRDMTIMGHVACLEYYALAHVRKHARRFPKLNMLNSLQTGKLT